MLTDLESEITRHFNHLCMEIGSRPNGSPGDYAAADYIQGVLLAAGLDVNVQEFECPAWVGPWPQSNHSTFAWRGVSAIAFSSAGRIRLDHLRAGSVEWVSPAKLKEVVSLVTEVVESLQDKSLDWSRELASRSWRSLTDRQPWP